MLLGTYRSGELSSPEHPLQIATHELSPHGHCRELKLQRLTEPSVRTYVTQCFVGAELPEPFVRFVHQRTDGNPLFMVNIVGQAVERELLVPQEGRWEWKADQAQNGCGLPANVHHLIASHIAHLSLQLQAILEAASVAGMSFTTATVAAALGREQEEIEQHCEQLARQGRFLRAKGLVSWPDGVAATQYEFLHALYQETFYERIAMGRRVILHQRLGVRLETGYGEQASAIAAELAMHFERGREYNRAVHYHHAAGEVALQRYAHQEAIAHFTTGLELLSTLPETPERDQRELQLLAALGVPLYMMKGPTAPEAETIYERAHELCRRLEISPPLVPAYLGLVRYYAIHGELQTADELGDKLLTLAQRLQDPLLLPTAHATQGGVRFFLGNFTAARIQTEQAVGRYDVQKHGSLIFLYGEDPGVMGLTAQCRTLWHLGYPDQALQKCQEAHRLAQAIPHPFNITHVQMSVAWLHRLRGEIQETQQWAEALSAFSTKQEVPFWLAPGVAIRGWALTEQGVLDEGIALMRRGVKQVQALGAEVWRIVYHVMFSEVYQKAGQLDEGQRCMDEAFTRAQAVGEFFYSAEIYRLKGELLLRSPTSLGQVQGKSKQVRKP